MSLEHKVCRVMSEGLLVGLTTIQFRRGTTYQWDVHNPILRKNEPAIDTTEMRIKVGDGITEWKDLRWFFDEESK